MNCKQCDTQLIDGVKFCTQCGAKAAAITKAITCPEGFKGLVLLDIRDDGYEILVYVPKQKKPLSDDGDFFHNASGDGYMTGIDLPQYLYSTAFMVCEYPLDRDAAAKLISSRLSELKYLQLGGFLPSDIAFEVRDTRRSE
jgi:hypothetical protein